MTKNIIKSFAIVVCSLLLCLFVLLVCFAMSPTSAEIAIALNFNDSLKANSVVDASDNIISQPTNDDNVTNSKALSKNMSTKIPFESFLQSDLNGCSQEVASEKNIHSDSALIYTTDEIFKQSYENKYSEDFVDYCIEKNIPTFYDLRNVDGKNFVSNVKKQGSWQTCWAFAIIAASEINIQSHLGVNYYFNPIDLSEKHLSWFANNAISENQQSDCETSKTQVGEGKCYLDGVLDKNQNYPYLDGGWCYYGANTFSNYIGICKDTDYPYRGLLGRVQKKINDKIVVYNSYEDAKAKGVEPDFYAKNDDWTLNENCRFEYEYKLKESKVLPNIKPFKDNNGQYVLDEQAISILKNQLIDGNGVVITFTADFTNPSEDPSQFTDRYLNTYTWSQYVWGDSANDYVNHGVCIVGYDDNYDKNNFTIESPVKWDSNQNPIFKLNGMNLSNDQSGNPYYEKVVDGNTVKIVLDKNSPLIELRKGSLNEYKLLETELENNSSGKPYYPDGTKQVLMPDVSILCETVRDESGSHTPPNNGAWICKNSWGANSESFPNHSEWGNDGYFYISYYDLSLCFPQTYEFDINSDNKNLENEVVYAYDYMPTPYPYSGVFDDSSYSGFKSGNVFSTSVDVNINSASVVTASPNTNCDFYVYLLDEDTTNPEDGQLLFHITEKYEYAGFHVCNFNKDLFIPNGKKFSVMVGQVSEVSESSGKIASYQNIPLSFDYNENYYGPISQINSYFNAVVNPGESFVIYHRISDDQDCFYDWKDFMNTPDFYAMSSSVFKDDSKRKFYDIDNVAVKAYGEKVNNNSQDLIDYEDNMLESTLPATTCDYDMLIALFVFIVTIVVNLLFIKYNNKQ